MADFTLLSLNIGLTSGMKYWWVVFLVACSLRGSAQLFDTVKVPMDPRLSDLPYYSFSQGLGLTAPDSAYSMNIRFRMQLRAANAFENGVIAENQWAVRRLRLRFDGFAFSPRLTYAIQLSFATEDASGEVDNNNLNLIRDAVLYYRLDNGLTFGFGQTKLPGNRERVNSSSALQLVDRSIANAAFNIDRDFGFFGILRRVKLDQPGYILRGAVTSGKGRNWKSFDSYGLCYTGRVEWYPFGDFTNNGVFFEGDLEREQRPKLMVGTTYSFNDNAIRQAGQLGNLMYSNLDLSSGFLDIIFKYKGFAMMVDVMGRGSSGEPITVSPADSSVVAAVVGWGSHMQASYLFKKNYEIVARFSQVQPDQAVAAEFPVTHEYRLGVNKYLRGHSLKLQFDAGLLTFMTPNGPEPNQWSFRFQVELGI